MILTMMSLTCAGAPERRWCCRIIGSRDASEHYAAPIATGKKAMPNLEPYTPKELSPVEAVEALGRGMRPSESRVFAYQRALANARELEELRDRIDRIHASDEYAALERLRETQSDVTELITAIASGEPVTEAHRDLARMIVERWESEAKR